MSCVAATQNCFCRVETPWWAEGNVCKWLPVHHVVKRIRECVATYLKSGMPLGVLSPAPTITTILEHSFFRINSVTSLRLSFTFPPLFPPLPTPKNTIGMLDKEKGRTPWILPATQQKHKRLLRSKYKFCSATTKNYSSSKSHELIAVKR